MKCLAQEHSARLNESRPLDPWATKATEHSSLLNLIMLQIVEDGKRLEKEVTDKGPGGGFLLNVMSVKKKT